MNNEKEPIGVSAPAETTITEGFSRDEARKIGREINQSNNPDYEPTGKHQKPESFLAKTVGKLMSRKELPAGKHEMPPTTEDADPELSQRLDAIVPSDEDLKEADEARTKVISEGLADINDEDKNEAA